MLWVIALILLLLWLGGFIIHLGGALIHILLVLAIVFLIAHFLRGRGTAV
jgi:hypothetical protein